MAQAKTIPMSRHPYADGSYKKMLIDGKWVDAASGKHFESRNPATGELLATVAEGDAEDINRAVAAARKAFEGPWSKFKPYERQQILLKLADLVERHFDELSSLDTLDMGAPISRTRGTRLRVLGMLRYYAGQATAIHGETIPNSLPGEIFSYTLKEPVGVVGAIIPWNGPLGASVWKIGPALAAGCTVILKPAEEAPLTPLRLGELAVEAGVPPGVVNVVPGYGETAGAALASHPGVDKVAFTGSHVTGQSIVRASAGNLKRVSLELGGKSPTSSLPTPTSRRRCPAPPWRCSPIPARSAARARGCSSSKKSMTNSPTGSRLSARTSASATGSIRKRKSARWCRTRVNL
jgi:aldehyde dehydrogenase (NAD+)